MSLALSVTQPVPSCTEHELIAAVRRGSDRAFEELYARYRDRISAYVLLKVRDHARAEDIAQEVFISALRRLRDTERPIAFKPWIYEIAKNACIDEFRRTRRVREVPLELDDGSENGNGAIASSRPTPDAAIEHKLSLDNLRGAFRGLSESHHRIIVMRELEGLSYAQIGERLGMTRPMVQSTLFRARRQLGEEYEELASGRRCEQIQGIVAHELPLRSLGIRQRRQLARHLSHCQPCRRFARMSGVDDSFFKAPSIAKKIAALFPWPLLRFRRGHRHADAAASAGSHQYAAMESFQRVAPFADPAAPTWALSRAAAAAAAIVIAGAGGGFATGFGSPSGHPTVRARAVTAAIPPSGTVPWTGQSGSSAAPNTSADKAQAAHTQMRNWAAWGSPAGPAGSATSKAPSKTGPGGSAPAASAPAGAAASPAGPGQQTASNPAGVAGVLGGVHVPGASLPSGPANPVGSLTKALPPLPSLPSLNPPKLPSLSLPQLPLPSVSKAASSVSALIQHKSN